MRELYTTLEVDEGEPELLRRRPNAGQVSACRRKVEENRVHPTS